MSLNEKAEAFGPWLKAIQRDPNSEHAANASGMILTSYASSKQWTDLVGAARIVQKMKLTPTVNGQNINLDTYLADGFFHSGLAAYAKGLFKPAAFFLERFTKEYPNDKRCLEAIYQKGLTYLKLGDGVRFGENMRDIVMDFGKSKYAKDAILIGMKSSTVLNDKIFFHETYLKQYPKAPDFQSLRETLANIHLENKSYGPAGLIYEQQSKDPTLSKNVKIVAALKQLKIEDEFGDMNKAKTVADYILLLGKGNETAIAKSLEFLIRYADKQKNVSVYDGYEKELAKMNGTNPDVMEALAGARYFLALREAAKPLPEIDSRTLKDPVKEIQNQLAIYQNLRVNFEKVCAVGRTSYCEKSKGGLSQMTVRSIAMIDSIVLSSALDERSVQAFETQKVRIRTILSQTVAKGGMGAAGH